jgi:hypothetical protein
MLSTGSTQTSKKRRNGICGLIVLSLLVFTFVYSLYKDMHKTVPEALGRHSASIGIAISGLEYGIDGYMGYGAVLNRLSEKGMTNDRKIAEQYGMTVEQILTNGPVLNAAIQATLSLDSSQWIHMYQLVAEDRGFIDYCKIAFSLFGYKVESLLYLYYLLLTISVSIYIASFYNRLEFIQLLCLFLCSHLVVLSAAPVIGIELQTVYNIRFLPVLGILPALYLSALVLGRLRYTMRTLTYSCIQTAILLFVVHIRHSIVCFIMSIGAVYILSCLYSWKRQPELGVYYFYQKHIWPLAVVLLGFCIFQFHQVIALSPLYSDEIKNKMIWHSLYVGLSAHPNSESKYGIENSDNTAYHLVQKISRDRYGIEKIVGYSDSLYERILKDEFMKIFIGDPVFVLENFILYKPYMFAQNFTFHYLNPYSLVFAFILGIFSSCHFRKRWPQFFFILFFLFVFSILPPIVDLPQPFLIVESALVLNMIILLSVAGIACQLRQYYLDR